MKWRLLFLSLLGSMAWAEQCQLTSPLPVPVTINNCTFSGAFLPSGSTNYIQNTSSLQSGSTFYVSSGSVQGNFYLPSLSSGKCVQTTTGGQLTTTGSACSAGGGGSGVTSVLAVTTGTSTGFSVITTSPTFAINFDSNTFNTYLEGGGTSFVQLNSSSVTLQGNFYTFSALETSTGTLQININSVGTATGTIQTQLTSVATATGTLASSVASSTTSLQGQVNDLVSPSTGVLAGAFPNTVIISSIAAQIQHNIAGLYLSTNTVGMATRTIASTDTVVFASAPVSSIIAATQYIYTLPYSSNAFNNGSGQVIQITKVDTSTGPVKIITQGPNLIDGTTGLLTLNSEGQTDELIADGNNGWWPHGQGIQITPSVLGLAQEANSTAIMTASSDTVICPFFTEIPVAVTGFRTFSITCTGASLGVANFAIYDSLGNLRVSSNTVTCPGAAAWQVTLGTPINLPPGQYYYGIQIDNAATNVAGLGPNGGNGATTCSRMTSTTGVLPNPFVFGTTDLKAPAVFVQVAGGKTGI